MPGSLEQIAEVSEWVLAAALDPQCWQPAIDRLSRVVGTQVCAQLMGYDQKTGLAPVAVAAGYDPQILKLYEEHYGRDNPYAAKFDTLPHGKVVSATQLCRPEDLKDTAFYSDILRPQGDIFCGGGMLLFKDDQRTFVIGGNLRSKDQNRFEADWLSSVERIAPVIQHSLEVNRMISGLSFEKSAADQHQLGDGTAMFVIDPSFRIEFACADGQSLLEAGSVCGQFLDGRFCLRAGDAQAQLAQIAGLQQRDTTAPLFRSWSVFDAGGRRWTCRVTGMRLADLDWSPFGAFLDRSQSALLVALKPDVLQAELKDIIRQALDLSASEAEISVHLADGLTAVEIADNREVSVYTVRNQIKSALSKSGCRRQSDLVKRVEQLRSSYPQ